MCSGAGAESPELNYNIRVVSNEPSSVTWLVTPGISKIHADSWRIHIEKLTTLEAQDV